VAGGGIEFAAKPPVAGSPVAMATSAPGLVRLTFFWLFVAVPLVWGFGVTVMQAWALVG
jgi:hypothetical protein